MNILDLPLEIINKIALSVDDGKSFCQLLLSNKIFILSITNKEFKIKCESYERYNFSRLEINLLTDNTPFILPQGIALESKSGNILIVDENSDCVQVFGHNGKFVRKFGSEGKKPGQLKHPQGIVTTTGGSVGANGSIVVTEGKNHRVSVFDDTGTFVRAFGCDPPLSLGYPTGVTVNSEDHIIVVDQRNHRLVVFGSVSDHVLDTFGSRGIANGQFHCPNDVCVDQQDNIIVTDCNNHRVQIFDGAGATAQFITSFGSESKGLQYPWGVCVDSSSRGSGQIIISDYWNNRLSVWSNDGSCFIRHIPNLPARPTWIAMTRSGRKAFVSFDDHTVRCIRLR